jgi:DNA-binding response OmpR family regulator
MQILVVEDQDSIRRMIEALVSARGHKVVAVASGAKAVEMAMSTTPDVVLLDLHLPGQYDGFDVCKKLRAAPATKDVPVVIISARDDAPTRAEAQKIGATAYYGKPFSPTALLKEIEKIGRAGKKEAPKG